MVVLTTSISFYLKSCNLCYRVGRILLFSTGIYVLRFTLCKVLRVVNLFKDFAYSEYYTMHGNLNMQSPEYLNLVSMHTKNIRTNWGKGWHCSASVKSCKDFQQPPKNTFIKNTSFQMFFFNHSSSILKSIFYYFLNGWYCY